MTAWPAGMAIRPIQQWPGEHSRSRQHAPFRASWSDTLELLRRELRMLGAKGVVLQVAMAERDFRIDGYPRANAKAEHPGVVLSFDSKYGALSYPCDSYWDWQDNVRAIALAMEALRKVDRYGVTKRGEQYTGWKALPAGRGDAASGMTATDAAAILLRAAGESEHAPVNREVFPAIGASIVRRARAASHPDRHQGDTAQWHLVDNAEQTLRQAGWLPRAVSS